MNNCQFCGRITSYFHLYLQCYICVSCLAEYNWYSKFDEKPGYITPQTTGGEFYQGYRKGWFGYEKS